MVEKDGKKFFCFGCDQHQYPGCDTKGMYVFQTMIVSMIPQSPRWWIFRVGIPHSMWRICCSQYAHNFVMQMGIPVCKYFSNSHPYAYRDPRKHTGIPVCIILHMGIQDLISHMETISYAYRDPHMQTYQPYANVPESTLKNHLENH